MTETIAEKAGRYLIEARFNITAVNDGHVHATCRGQGAQYELGWSRGGGWYCDCPAKGLCSHLLGLMNVIVRPKAGTV